MSSRGESGLRLVVEGKRFIDYYFSVCHVTFTLGNYISK